MKVLVACEESQAVCKAFRSVGHEAYSCDVVPCSGGHPEWHIQVDALELLKVKWDMIIAFPPCTHLCVSGARWFTSGHKDIELQYAARDFFMRFIEADCPRIAVENPVGRMSTYYRKPDQIIQPYQFGHPEQKRTCLWLKGLPSLVETCNVYSEMMRLPLKERTRVHWLGSNHSVERSKTYPGIASAMASQWGSLSV